MQAVIAALSLVLTLGISCYAQAGQYFVATSGSDTSQGTFDQPFATILQAHSVVSAGDTIYVRGGVYTISLTLTLNKIGTDSAMFYLLAYHDERALLDFSSMAFSSTNRGISLSGDFWYVRGLDIKGAGDNGMNISGSYNIVENCSFYENSDTGLQLGNGASNNQIINCDSYFNVNPDGQDDADGFAPKLSVGSGNYFYGCRAWQNSDDGFDGFLRESNDVTTVLENCWIFMNGYLKDGSPSSGNGNGFKMGGMNNLGDSLKHNVTLKNCLAFDNRMKGFDQNHNRGSMTIYNGTAYRNGSNYSLNETVAFGKTMTIINSIALGSSGPIIVTVIQETNSWMDQFSPTAEDFASIDTTDVRGPRKPDGSLPDIQFMHLTAGSVLIDSGTDVGLPFVGIAPDLGAFEFSPVTSIVQANDIPSSFVVAQTYPNPFNPETSIRFEIPASGIVSILIYNILGKEVRKLANSEFQAGTHLLRWNAKDNDGLHVTSGTYFATVKYNTNAKTLKLVLTR